MAGPNLTGWTATTITPVAKTVAIPAARKQNPVPPAGMPDPATMTASQLHAWGRWEDAAIRRAEEIKARKATAVALEKEAQATKDPAKLKEAWSAIKRTAFDEAPFTEGGRSNARVEAQHNLAVDFKKRNPAFEFPVDPTGFSQDKAIFEAPSGSVRSYLSKKLFEETGLGTGTQLDTDIAKKPRFMSSGGGGAGGAPTAYADGTPVNPPGGPVATADAPGQEVRSDVIGGLAPNYGNQVAGAAGGPSLSGPTSGWTPTPIPGEAPTTSFSAPTAPNTMTGNRSSPTDAYNLTPSELGSAGPDPRIAAAPTTPLEQLLRTIYPDAPTSTADPLADPRNPGAGPSGFADVLAYINSQGSGGSGYVPAPQMGAPAGVPSAGANIASTIPGAPSWLGPQINSLPGGGGGGFVQAPPTGGGMNLAGLAAISAEQRVQQAQLDAEIKRRQDEYFAQINAERELAARKTLLARQQGNLSAPGWQTPAPALYKDGKFFAGELPY